MERSCIDSVVISTQDSEGYRWYFQKIIIFVFASKRSDQELKICPKKSDSNAFEDYVNKY